MLCVRPTEATMSDGDTRKVNEAVLKDPSAKWKPMEQFRSFQKSDQIWVLVGIGLLILTLNIVFGFGNSGGTVG